MRSALPAALALTVTAPSLQALVDTNHDGISDTWAGLHPTAGAPAADPDGDGASNLAESLAGTNPLDPTSRFSSSFFTDVAGALHLRWPSVGAKRYQLQTSADLLTWDTLPAVYAGTGADLDGIVRAAGATTEAHRYWRVSVSDIDSNHDGISDWEQAAAPVLIRSRLVEKDRAENNKVAVTTIDKWLANQLPDGSWVDVDYADTSKAPWKPLVHLDRLAGMAAAASTVGNRHYHTPAIADAIARGIQFWITRRPGSLNLWQNDIGVPLDLGPTLLLMQDRLPPDLVTAALALIPKQPNDPTWGTGENLVWYSGGSIHRALVAGNDALLASSVAQIESTLQIVTGDGIQTDGSFYQHGKQLYNGGYGLGFVGDVAEWVQTLSGTAYAIDAAHQSLLEHLLLAGDAWMIRRTTFDSSTQGRNYARDDSATPAGLTAQVRAAIDLLLAAGSPRAAELQMLRDHIVGTGVGLVGHKHFWRGDYTVHREAAAMVSLRLTSARTTGAECANNENLRGLFQGCGETMIYRDGLEYHGLFPAWNWLRLPGTTLEQTASVPPFFGYAYGTAPFVGGVSDGAVGLSVLTHANLRAKSLIDGKVELRPLPAARKSWFFFGEGFLALGAGITSATANPVYTTLNQCLLRGAVRLQTSGTVITQPAGGETAVPATSWVQHDSVGYVFPAPTTVHLAATTQTGSWNLITAYKSTAPVTKDVFTLGLDHGVAPTGATYAYIVLPGADEAATAAFATQNPVTILSHTPQLQAARIASRDLSAVAFFEAGSVTLKPGLTVTSDQPALVLVRGVATGLEVTIAEPTQLRASLNLTLSGKLTGPGAVYDSANGTTHVTVALPSADQAGSSVKLLLAY